MSPFAAIHIQQMIRDLANAPRSVGQSNMEMDLWSTRVQMKARRWRTRGIKDEDIPVIKAEYAKMQEYAKWHRNYCIKHDLKEAP